MVIVSVNETKPVRILTVDFCPYCKKKHSHGGGYSRDPPNLGQRSAHCGKGSYILTTVRRLNRPMSA